MRILALDPSVHNVGWCRVDTSKQSLRRIWQWGTFKLEGNSLEMKVLDLIQRIKADVGSFDMLVTEKPMFFSSERGQIAAHMNYTIDLAAVNYYVAGWFHMDHRTHFAITANQWKGSVPKDVTARRFFRDFPKVKSIAISEHAIDAAMMLRYWIESMAMYLPSMPIADLSRAISQGVRQAAV